MAKAKNKSIDYAAQLQVRFDHWDNININGGSDPSWADGVNMNLVRNHILHGKREIEENIGGLAYPEIYYRETPPEVDSSYMARADEIRQNARKSLEAYKASPDYQYLCRTITRMNKKQISETSIDSVINYATSLEHAIENDNLVKMRQHERTQSYLDSFASCVQRILNLPALDVEYKQEKKGVSTIDRK